MSSLAGLYAYLTSKNQVILPLEKVEAAKEKLKEFSECHTEIKQVQEVVGNISIEELGQIITTAQLYAIDGFTAAEAQQIGVLIIEAVKEK